MDHISESVTYQVDTPYLRIMAHGAHPAPTHGESSCLAEVNLPNFVGTISMDEQCVNRMARIDFSRSDC